MNRRTDLGDSVRRAIDRYFRDLDGESPCAIYEMVVSSVERSMLETVMRHASGNQTVAADMLGINRNTLRRKLGEYDLL
jgi:Fis family transcriptional regulator